MNLQKQTEMRIDIATKAVVLDLERFQEKNPGGHIPSRELFKHAAKRAGWIMDDDYDIDYDLEAIPPPTPEFIKTHWKTIKLLAARKHQKYIVWEPWTGVRLGTFEEYQSTRPIMARMAIGISRSIAKINKVVEDRGGKPYLLEVRQKQLPSGDDKSE